MTKEELLNSVQRIKNDINGNPRYVFHFLDLSTDDEKDKKGFITQLYDKVCKRMNQIGGKKYNNKFHKLKNIMDMLN